MHGRWFGPPAKFLFWLGILGFGAAANGGDFLPQFVGRKNFDFVAPAQHETQQAASARDGHFDGNGFFVVGGFWMMFQRFLRRVEAAFGENAGGLARGFQTNEQRFAVDAVETIFG